MSKNNNNNKGDGGGEKKTASITVILKVTMHCDGCASKLVKTLRAFQGVETVKAEAETGKITVTGDLDPAKLREQLEVKIKKKVELVSPQPKKESEKEKDSNKNTTNEDKTKDKKSEEKKPKEAPVTTAVLKLDFHCQSCIGRIQKTVYKTKGVSNVSIDHEKQLVTAKGTMDVKKLAKSLAVKLKRNVEIVPPAAKKEKESGEKNKGDGGGKDNSGSKGGEGVNMVEHVAAQPERESAYYPGEPAENPIQAALQLFSDDNPNSCVVL